MITGLYNQLRLADVLRPLLVRMQLAFPPRLLQSHQIDGDGVAAAEDPVVVAPLQVKESVLKRIRGRVFRIQSGA